jgi:hypothetical protein
LLKNHGIGFSVYTSDNKQLFYGLSGKGHDQETTGNLIHDLRLSIILGPFLFEFFSPNRFEIMTDYSFFFDWSECHHFQLPQITQTFLYCSWKQMDLDWPKKKLMIYQYSLNHFKHLDSFSLLSLFCSSIGIYVHSNSLLVLFS